MTEAFYIQISVTDEQKQYARQLVEFSLSHHKVSNIWDKQNDRIAQTRIMRYTGSLGEIVFADAYHLPRPLKSFGATDGQDSGQDFQVSSGADAFSLDIKSMKRKNGDLSAHYVLNIPAHQVRKAGSKTSHYFCISFHQETDGPTIASFLGFIDKTSLENGEVGTLFKKGTERIRFDKTTFVFHEDTYEILLKDIAAPVTTDFIRAMTGYRVCRLRG